MAKLSVAGGVDSNNKIKMSPGLDLVTANKVK